MIRVFNTLTNQKEKFVPQNPQKVLMYVCGPTVYNYIHIGNARSLVAFDTIRRYLEYRGYQVDYVSNFTDVDDKIIRAAKEQKITPHELTTKYIEAFHEDRLALNVLPATLNPKATDNMNEIISFIQDLLAKGYAYESAGDVYYRTRKFAHYGQLSNQSVDDLEQGASQRITARETAKKEDPLDFALWKQSPADELSWPSPFGYGRPGWHIECSVMAGKYLGATIDIHAGGEDLIFPHHENEIAQSEVHTEQQFAKYWLHNGFVTVGEANEKMSKSLGNFVTVHELLQQVDPQVVRLFMASTQYRRPIQYSKANLQASQNNLQHLTATWQNLNFRLEQLNAQSPLDETVQRQLAQLEHQFQTHMDDDFNVQNGLSDLFEIQRLINTYLKRAQVNQQNLQQLQQVFAQLAGIFGIQFQSEQQLAAQVQDLIEQRQLARQQKDFAQSDAIRDQLKAQGIILEDTPQGTRWHKG
ncbi:cysteine--tRNA ligase [Bombilactobacillus folatiphilus]|uniref:Cysteine--tRNA ligase n=1 Tax=Bombilactobacillus folatiphilus TaxID=2923362 RepID=A0ABY4PA29_9LACO|nr:cysteine--tRNA ligase [Bombilactobacillus folatiphilus]UQS82404.1 cysteine--tRNA ligase [Bombilactobacillus folatiphilus]